MNMKWLRRLLHRARDFVGRVYRLLCDLCDFADAYASA